MNCSNKGDLLRKYLNGTTNVDEEKAFEEHIAGCETCQQQLDTHLASSERDAVIRDKAQLDALPKEQHKRIIQKAKWRNRLSNSLTGVGFLIILGCLSFILTFFYYAIGDKSERARLTIETLTQMTMPNVYVGLSYDEVNTFFNAEIKGDLNKLVGMEEQVIGDLEGKMVFNQLNVNRDWVNGTYKEKLYFLNTKSSDAASVENVAWKTLEKLPEGTVAELAVTFNETMTFNQFYELIQPYEVRPAWYGINTGNIASPKIPYIFALNGAIGIHEQALYDFMLDESVFIQGTKSEQYEYAFKYALQFLSENKKYVKAYGTWLNEDALDFEAQLQYIEQNGIKLYGAVITGPTEELLKLQSNNRIIFATVGEVDFWNWNEPLDMSFSFTN